MVLGPHTPTSVGGVETTRMWVVRLEARVDIDIARCLDAEKAKSTETPGKEAIGTQEFRCGQTRAGDISLPEHRTGKADGGQHGRWSK